MSFTTGMNKLTKTTTVADGTTNLQTQHFSVWAYAAYEDENTTATEMQIMVSILIRSTTGQVLARTFVSLLFQLKALG